MSRNRGLWFTSLALLALASTAQAARVQHAVTFNPGSPNTYFNGTMNATGTLSMAFNGNINITTPEILGSPISITAPLVIPSQTVNIASVPNPFNFSVSPTGTMTLDLPKSPETFFGTFPNTADTLKDAEIPNLDVTLVGPSGIGFSTNTVNVTGSATIDILGITDFDIPLAATLTPNAVLKNIIYNQVDGAFVTSDGTVTVPPVMAGEPSGSVETSYLPLPLLGSVVSAGTGSLQADANMTGQVAIDLGIFGTTTQDLGTVPLLENETLSLDTLGLIFDMFKLRDLEPGVYNGTPRNINLKMEGDLDILGGPIELEFEESFSQAIAIPFQFTVNILGSDVTLNGNLTGNLTATLDALFGLSGVSFGLEDQVITDVLVPEPSSIALAGLGLVALVPVMWRRRKQA